MKQTLIVFTLLGLVLYACSTEKEDSAENTVDNFFETFNMRQEFDKFLGFYAEDVVLEDMINGDRVVGKEQLRNFFDWDNPDLKIIGPNSLVVSEKIIEQNKAVVKGYFTKFLWQGTEFEAMHFTTILTFNEAGKIIKQIDWINYPTTLVNYNERKNSNHWIR